MHTDEQYSSFRNYSDNISTQKCRRIYLDRRGTRLAAACYFNRRIFPKTVKNCLWTHSNHLHLIRLDNPFHGHTSIWEKYILLIQHTGICLHILKTSWFIIVTVKTSKEGTTTSKLCFWWKCFFKRHYFHIPIHQNHPDSLACHHKYWYCINIWCSCHIWNVYQVLHMPRHSQPMK